MANEQDDDTPVTLPGRPRPSNGIPRAIAFENTDEIVRAVKDTGSEDLMTAFITKAAEAFAKSGNGGDAGDKVLKDIKRHKWIAAVMALIIGPGGMVGAYYAIRDRSIANATQVERLNEATKTAAPLIEKNAEDIRLIKVDISGINTSMSTMERQNGTIASGVEDLKKENINRLQKDLDEANRKLQRLERDR